MKEYYVSAMVVYDDEVYANSEEEAIDEVLGIKENNDEC